MNFGIAGHDTLQDSGLPAAPYEKQCLVNVRPVKIRVKWLGARCATAGSRSILPFCNRERAVPWLTVCSHSRRRPEENLHLTTGGHRAWASTRRRTCWQGSGGRCRGMLCRAAG